MRDLTWTAEGGINWCWWSVTEQRPDGIYLVGHFRERWEWSPPKESKRGRGMLCEDRNAKTADGRPRRFQYLGMMTQNITGATIENCDVCVFAGQDDNLENFGLEFRPKQ